MWLSFFYFDLRALQHVYFCWNHFYTVKPWINTGEINTSGWSPWSQHHPLDEDDAGDLDHGDDNNNNKDYDEQSCGLCGENSFDEKDEDDDDKQAPRLLDGDVDVLGLL